MAYVYRHIRLDTNEVFYIGIGKDSYRAYSKDNRNIYWKRITSKTNYDIEIILDELTWDEACEKEKEFIILYGRSDLKLGTLCNLTDGGDGSFGTLYSEERKKELSKKYSGELNPFYGKKHTEETLKIIGEKSKGRYKSPEAIEKWKSKMNFKKSPEVREKIRQSLLGKKHTEERKKNNILGRIAKKNKKS
jgi:hypothetical protein